MSMRRIVFCLGLALLTVLAIRIPIRSQYDETLAAAQSILAGRNVNMISGTKLPFGDPWLQRQNEPSLAASTRNPLHIFSGGNDYRTIDVPDQFELPGIEAAANAHDAWLGVYESFDGGESWVTTLLPGYPQDMSSEAAASPIFGYQTACDPIVRAGANGLIYYCGIAFDHSKNRSAIFVARYQDDNNLEKVEVKVEGGVRKYFGPIRYIDTKLVAKGSTSSSFIDMPNMAVDIPRKGALYGNVYVAYTVFTNTSQNNTQDMIMFQKSTDGGATWSAQPVRLSAQGQLAQRPVIAVDPIDLTGKTIYVAFRRFAGGGYSDGIVVVRSTDGGKTFSKLPDIASSFFPFDQGTSTASFRTNSYPTMAVGDLGTVYVAWSQRQGGPSGQAKIMISAFKKGGLSWTTPKIVDSTYTGPGHQFMPSLSFAAWKLMLIWYDQRGDVALDNADFIEDSPGETRHTIDVRAAEGKPGVPPSFSPSIQLSRYLYVLDLDADGNPKVVNGYQKVIQAEYNPINYPLFHLGTVPFHGDYLEVTPSVKILPPPLGFGFWIYNINPLEPTSFHAAWTDNRDVRPPGGDTWGDWTNYNAPSSDQDSYWEGPSCGNVANTGMRNQNIYTSHINKGIIMGSPGNSKQLDLPISGYGGRAFVVFVKNTTALERTLNLAIQQIGGVNASFDQFTNDDHIQVKVQPYSSASTTVYVDRSTRRLAPVMVTAFEGAKLVGYVVLNPDPTNLPLSDPANPFLNLGNETHDPKVSDPKVWNYDLGSPDEPHPSAILNPRGQNESVVNDELANPRGQNADVLNPRGQNESVVNYEVANPRGQNVGVENTALTDVTWTVTNDGNTTSAFRFNIVSNPDGVNLFNQDNPPLIGQVLVYKLHKVPVDKECQLYEMRQDELILNVTKPQVQNPRGQNNPPASSAWSVQSSSLSTQGADLGSQDITFNLGPGEQADVIFRVWDENTADGSPTFTPNMVASEAVAEAVNTDDVVQGYTTPSYDTPPNSTPWTTPSPQISTTPQSMSFSATVGGSTPSQTLYISNSGGGTLSYTLTVDANWLTISPTFGTSAGVNYPVQHTVSVNTSGLAAGTYTGTITISDPMASNNPLRIPVTLTLGTGGVTPGLIAYYPFSGSANDESGNGNNGIVHGAALTQDRFGNPNGAYSFDGQSSYIAVPDSPTLDITGPITIAAWIKPTVASGTYIVTKGDPTVGGNVYDLDIYPGQVRSLFHYQGGGSATRGATGATNIVSGTWQHVAVTWDGATVTVYYNGQPDGTGSFTTGPIITSSMDLEIGRYYGGAPQPYFAGDIDDVRIYNGALSAAEIQALYLYSSGGTDQESAPLISTGTYQDYFPPLEEEMWVPHWFKVAVEEGQDMRVSTGDAVSPSGYTDLDMTIHDGTGGILAGAYSSRSDETVYLSNEPAGMYYIVIWGPPDVRYTLTIATGDLTGIGEITGRITNSLGNGVGNILIEVYQVNEVPDPRQVFAVTDSNGFYKIAYTPGDYKLYITCSEYFMVPSDPYVLPQWYPGKADFASADVLSITAGVTNSGHDDQLADGAAISGRVTSATGEQVVQTLIQAYNPDGSGTSGYTRANNPDYLVGHIRIPAGGNVNLRFSGFGVPSGYIIEWYNDKYSMAAADLIPVHVRETTQGIDAQLFAAGGAGSIQGRVTNGNGDGIPNVKVYAYDSAQGQIRGATTDSNGNYAINGLPTFAAKVFFDASQTTYASQWYSGKSDFTSADTVSVDYGSTKSGINAVLSP
jgi:Concanavalin A-like lectin/glucanases superfamily/Carboxypeptidase regulatory-like domain/Viral BACON domain